MTGGLFGGLRQKPPNPPYMNYNYFRNNQKITDNTKLIKTIVVIGK
jgi:hypothetical protein